MKPECSLLHLQEPVTCPHPESDQSSLRHISLLEDPF